jgi:hypothetical protein
MMNGLRDEVTFFIFANLDSCNIFYNFLYYMKGKTPEGIEQRFMEAKRTFSDLLEFLTPAQENAYNLNII